MLDSVGVPRARQQTLPDLAKPTSDPVASGRLLARELRGHFNLGLQPLADIDGFLEEVGVLVIGRPLGDSDDALSGACTNHPQFRVALINTDHWGTRQRFTAAHELGHILFGDAAPNEWHDDPPEHVQSSSSSAEEIRANSFAAELLLPLEAVGRVVARLGVTEEALCDLMFDFGVSLPAAVHLLRDGGHLSGSQEGHWLALSASNLAWTFNRQSEHHAFGEAKGRVRAPTAIHQRAMQAYTMGGIGIGPLAGLLGADVTALRKELDEAGLSPALHSEVDVLELL